jgi:hypothetical protein
MDVVPATVSQLQNPTTLQLGQLISSTEDGISVPGLLCLCSCTAALAAQNGCGCAATDFADIVQQDPFFHTGVAAGSTPLQINSVIPNRFAYVNTELLDYGVQSTYTIDDKNTTQTVYTTTNMDSVGLQQQQHLLHSPSLHHHPQKRQHVDLDRHHGNHQGQYLGPHDDGFPELHHRRLLFQRGHLFGHGLPHLRLRAGLFVDVSLPIAAHAKKKQLRGGRKTRKEGFRLS